MKTSEILKLYLKHKKAVTKTNKEVKVSAAKEKKVNKKLIKK